MPAVPKHRTAQEIVRVRDLRRDCLVEWRNARFLRELRRAWRSGRLRFSAQLTVVCADAVLAVLTCAI